jgi:hypothetical protein
LINPVVYPENPVLPNFEKQDGGSTAQVRMKSVNFPLVSCYIYWYTTFDREKNQKNILQPGDFLFKVIGP